MLVKSVICTLLAATLALGGSAAYTEAAAKHNVTYIYGTKMTTVQVSHGQNAPVPADTYVPGYQFLSWVGNTLNPNYSRRHEKIKNPSSGCSL